MQSAIRSPCVRNCNMPEYGSVCKGCGRTLTEITDWPKLSDNEKTRVLELAKYRKTHNISVA